jgi:hypothetical protein
MVDAGGCAGALCGHDRSHRCSTRESKVAAEEVLGVLDVVGGKSSKSTRVPSPLIAIRRR